MVPRAKTVAVTARGHQGAVPPRPISERAQSHSSREEGDKCGHQISVVSFRLLDWIQEMAVAWVSGAWSPGLLGKEEPRRSGLRLLGDRSGDGKKNVTFFGLTVPK
ncbi:uncharacterized protein LOC118533304 [Halichoerus grypus]